MKKQRKQQKNSFIIVESDPASKQQILKSALRLFVRNGPSDPTAREIAALAGYSNPTIFKYFGTKDKLALYLFKLCYQRVTGEFHRAVDFERPFRENLQAILGAHQRLTEGNLDVYLYSTEHTRRYWQFLSAEWRNQRIGLLLTRLFEKGKAEGAVSQNVDTYTVVVAVLGLLFQSARMCYYGDDVPGPAGDWNVAMENIILKMCA